MIVAAKDFHAQLEPLPAVPRFTTCMPFTDSPAVTGAEAPTVPCRDTGEPSRPSEPPDDHVAPASPYEVTHNGDPLTGKPVAAPVLPEGLTPEQAEEFVRVAGQAYNLANTYFPGVVARASGLPADLVDARVGAHYLDAVMTEFDAADTLEKQMLEQICALHLTYGQLSLKAARLDHTEAFRVVMEVALRCQAEHRRTSLALVQYRQAKQKLAAGVENPQAAGKQGGKPDCQVIAPVKSKPRLQRGAARTCKKTRAA